jgi:phosphoribosyl 1,2-cyclic phosphate phosphodiesterase
VRLLFLGTAAAEAYPAAFCGCENCERARRNGGRDLRHRSSLLVDDDLLIDLGPDIMHAALAYNLRLYHLRTVLVTHAHADHFDTGILRWRRPGFRATEPLPLAVYGPAEVAAAVEGMEHFAEVDVKAVAVGAYQRFAVEGAEVWSFPARHGTEAPLIYAVARGGAKLLYACDTGDPGDEVWGALAEHQFDAIIMEETMGTGQSRLHTNIDEIAAHRERALKDGFLKPDGRFIATHFSHGNNPAHAELSSVLGSFGVEAAYDGMEVMLDERHGAA